MVVPRPVCFVGGELGAWEVQRVTAVTGPPLARTARLAVSDRAGDLRPGEQWALRGITSNERYTERNERALLQARQPPLERPEATRAALIPIRKSEAWWELAQDERRTILETRSHHIATGVRYLPAVARRLYHSRELGEQFDFLTWFEFSPTAVNAFEELVGGLRQTEEWLYVEREVDIRLAWWGGGLLDALPK